MAQQVETGRYSCREERYVIFHSFEDGLDTLMVGLGFVCNMKLWSLSAQKDKQISTHRKIVTD
jgi:hypothetical protein